VVIVQPKGELAAVELLVARKGHQVTSGLACWWMSAFGCTAGFSLVQSVYPPFFNTSSLMLGTVIEMTFATTTDN